jgi:hypothetical protein
MVTSAFGVFGRLSTELSVCIPELEIVRDRVRIQAQGSQSSDVQNRIGIGMAEMQDRRSCWPADTVQQGHDFSAQSFRIGA